MGEGATSERTTHEWFKKLRSGDFILKDRTGRRRLPEADNDELKGILDSNLRTPTREIAEELNVDNATAARHWKKTGNKKIY